MAANTAPHKTVTLHDWWLIKPDTNTHTLGVAGHTYQQNRATRCFSSAPILQIFDLFDLETVDGVCVLLRGLINKQRTLQNGFPPQVFDDFVIGFPPNWKDWCSKCAPTVQEAVEEEHAHFHDKPNNSDTDVLDFGVQDCKDILLNDKTSTPLGTPLVEVPREDVTEAGNEVLCERYSVTPGFEGDPSLKTSPIVSHIVESCTRSKFSGVSRRVTRSMKKMDNTEISNKETVNVVDCDMKSKSRKTVSKSSDDTVIQTESKEKQIDQNVDFVITEDTINKDDADVNGESLIDIEITDIEEKHITPNCSGPLNNTSVGATDENDGNVLVRTNTKGRRYKKKNRRQKEGALPTQGISIKEAMMTRNRSKTKLPVKRKLITSPKSAKSTSLRGKKGSEETCGSASILSIESFSGKKCRSGRVVLPPLEFWRNQKVVYDEGVCLVFLYVYDIVGYSVARSYWVVHVSKSCRGQFTKSYKIERCVESNNLTDTTMKKYFALAIMKD